MPPFVITPDPLTAAFRYSWVDPTGAERDLSFQTSPNLFVARGPKGFGSPPVDLELEKIPFAPGSIPRYIATNHTELQFPLYVGASDFGGLLVAARYVRRWFDTGNENEINPGYFRVRTPEGLSLQMRSIYAGGLEGDMEPGGPNWTMYSVSLIGPSSYWTDISPTEETYVPADFNLNQVLLNVGDFDTPPTWIIRGPIVNPTLQNVTTDKIMEFTASGGLTLASGERVTVDTRLASERSTISVYDHNGVNKFSKLEPDSALWWLRKGTNTIRLTGSGTTVDTSVTVSFLNRYRGALR